MSWSVHGLRFSQESGAGGADVRVVCAAVPLRLAEPVVSARYRDVGRGDWLLRLGPDTRLRAVGGHTIMLDAPSTVDPANLARWVLGPASTAILYQRNTLPLHASAVAIDGSVVALLAPSGLGKSTLAAALVANGASLVSDDVVAVRQAHDGSLAVWPGTTALRLLPESCTALERACFEASHSDPDGKRIMVPLGAPAACERPLAALFLLELGEAVAATAISGPALLMRLRRLLSRPGLARPLGAEQTCFAMLGRIVAQVPAWSLSRPADRWSLPECEALVRECLAVHHAAPRTEDRPVVHPA
jgi:hypothetical protein